MECCRTESKMLTNGGTVSPYLTIEGVGLPWCMVIALNGNCGDFDSSQWLEYIESPSDLLKADSVTLFVDMSVGGDQWECCVC